MPPHSLLPPLQGKGVEENTPLVGGVGMTAGRKMVRLWENKSGFCLVCLLTEATHDAQAFNPSHV